MAPKLRLHFSLLFIFTIFNLQSQILTDSNLPIVLIQTDIDPDTGSPSEIFDDPRVMASMKIIRRPDGTRNYLSDQFTAAFLDYNGRIDIEIRGSSSQDLPKKGYGLTTLEADNVTNNNVSLLDMPEENDWVLNGLAFDPSLIRDYLSYNLSEMIGNYSPRAVYCEVMINGEYQGLYLLQEKIKADSDRVNILKITESDNTLPNLTGGYITKADKTTGGDPVAWQMLSYTGMTDFIHEFPKPDDITSQQNAYIQSRFNILAFTANADNTSPTNGYPSVIDVPTFVDFMIINELASNADAYQLSTYFHQDRNGKLRAGPVWDHNLTYGNDLFLWGFDRSHYDVWQFDNGDNTGATFWKDLFDNPDFRCYFSKRFNELILPGQPLKHNNLVTFIDNTVSHISEAIAREDQKWNTIANHGLEIDNMKMFLYQRLNWMSANIGAFSACSSIDLPQLVISRIHYNPEPSGPFSSNDSEFIEITNADDSTVSLTGIYFRELGITYRFPANSSLTPGQKIFLASNSTVFQSRYGMTAFGQFTRNLSNKSQKLVLADAFGNIIDSVQYHDSAPWPDADGNGYYLQLTSTLSDNSLAASWEPSSTSLGNTYSDTIVFSVAPNPVDDFLDISSPAEINSIEITDISGRRIVNRLINSNSCQADFAGFNTGIYILKIHTADGSLTRKIMKR